MRFTLLELDTLGEFDAVLFDANFPSSRRIDQLG